MEKRSTVKGVLAKLDTYGFLVSQEELLKVAYILNVKITDELQNTNLPSSLDFTTILASYSDIKPHTLEDLHNFASNRLNWKCFELGQASVYEEMWWIRSFFQAMHPLGVSFIEGNHHAVLASKLLYGHAVDATFPLKRYNIDRKWLSRNSAVETRTLPY